MWIWQSFVIKYKTNFVCHDVYHKPLISFYSFKKFTYESLLLTVIEKTLGFSMITTDLFYMTSQVSTDTLLRSDIFRIRKHCN